VVESGIGFKGLIEDKMAVQQNKKSPSRRNMRRAHDKVVDTTIEEDDNGELHRRHHVTRGGVYRKRVIVSR
jgi:large subunit ribosomal protein L32